MSDARSIKVVALAASIFAFTSTAYAYPPETFTAKTNFQKAFKEGGFQGLTKQIIECYAKGSEPIADLQRSPESIRPFLRGSSSLKACYIEDVAAMILDEQVRDEISQKTGHHQGPSNAYYSDEQLGPRLNFYAVALFASHEEKHNYINGSFVELTRGLF